MDLSDLKSIPQQRLLLYLGLLGLLPVLVFAFLLFTKLENLNQLELQVENLKFAAELKGKKQSSNQALSQAFNESEHHYIDKNLETLIFLNQEAEHLRKVTNDPNFSNNDVIRKRLDFLTSPQNRLSFVEGAVQSTPQFQEMTETLAHPVEVDGGDVEKILSYVEGVNIGSFQAPPGRPQIVILELNLNRKPTGKSEVFELNMKLLKREFLQ